jgi:hypothetical protein
MIYVTNFMMPSFFDGLLDQGPFPMIISQVDAKKVARILRHADITRPLVNIDDDSLQFLFDYMGSEFDRIISKGDNIRMRRGDILIVVLNKKVYCMET